LASTGIGLVTANWAALAVVTVTVLFGLVFRIELEERSLVMALGDRYLLYARDQKRLIPFVW
jgi:protein-S-isoprenylcysteine O-methyltransferase Ste14